MQSTSTSSPLFLFLLLTPLVVLHIPSTTSFTPTTSYYVVCGTTATAAFLNRTFSSDTTNLGLFQHSPVSISSSASRSNPSPLPSIYAAARIFTSPFWYSFDVPPNSTLLLRLHFLPFNPTLLSSSLLLTSPTSSLVLLHNFTATDSTSPTIKEYLLWSHTDTLNLTFQPAPPSATAFVNAIELFTPPPNFINSTTPIPVGSSSTNEHQSMETIVRVNAGGPSIDSSGDPLWRSWVTDRDYLFIANAATHKFTNSSIAFAPVISGQLSTNETAPEDVYSTLQEMNRQVSASPNFNITWVVPVPAGFSYLVRLHFCDFVSVNPGDLLFNIYVNNQTGITDFQPSRITGQRKIVPLFVDFIVDAEAETKIWISVSGSSKSSDMTRNAILNGFEVFKMNNSFASLDGVDNPFFSSPQESKSSKSTAIIVAVIAVAVVGTILVVGCIVYRKRRSPAVPETKPSMPPSTNVASTAEPNSVTTTTTASSTTSLLQTTQTSVTGLRIPLLEVSHATNDFDESLVIGSGGFGKVYKGVLRNGTPVAVKCASPTSRQGFPEFQNEIMVLSQIRHRHLVALIGYCDEENNMILVYEYMSRGPLKELLHGPKSASPLSWKQRLEVCIGAARGLHYLHTGFTHSIIHRDVKSSNILLDNDYVAKVADFGLSRIGPGMDESHVSTAVKGSFGYLDPEYFKTQKLTEKSDVYSFGMVLFEALCGRQVIDPQRAREDINLAEWAVRKVREGRVEEIVDARIKGTVGGKSLWRFVETAVKCLADRGLERPAIGTVLWSLESALQLQEEEGARRRDEASVVEESGASSVGLPPEVMGRYSSMSELTESNIFSQLITRDGR